MTMLPKRSISETSPGGTTVVESYWLMIAGPSMRLPAQQRLAGVEPRRQLAQLAVDLEPGGALLPQRAGGHVGGALDLGHDERRHQADAAHADVRDLDVRALEAPRVLALVRVVEVADDPRLPVLVDLAGRQRDPQLIALAEVAAVGEALDDPALLGGCRPRSSCAPRLLLELLEARLEGRRVERRHPLVGRRHVLVDDVRREQPHAPP